jgi:hypothetical protein
MRQTLGTAVFSGMLGVTLFGIFLTPVFYYVIQWFADRRAEARRREEQELEGQQPKPPHDDGHPVGDGPVDVEFAFDANGEPVAAAGHGQGNGVARPHTTHVSH